jgi:hypothetical protein
MPGRGKYRSIKHPRQYRALKRKRGMSKKRAAMISNAWVRDDGVADGKRGRRGRKR